MALLVQTHDAERAVVAEVNDDTTVAELAAALGHASSQLFTVDGQLDRSATLAAAGLKSGASIAVDRQLLVDWKQLGPELRVIGGAGAGYRRRMDGAVHVIGRAADITLGGERVSRQHAEVQWLGDSFRIRDLGSKHGTLVDGVALTPREWVVCGSGVAVQLADTVITVVATASASPVRRHGGPFHTAHIGGRADTAPVAPAHNFAATRVASERRSLAPLVIPSAGAVALAAAAGGAPTGLALAATPAAVVVGLLADKGLSVRASRRAASKRSREVAEVRHEVARSAVDLGAAARVVHPDPASLAAAVERRTPKVWSISGDELTVRLGLRNKLGAVTVEAPTADKDAFTEAATAFLVPATIRLTDGPVVLAGAESQLDDLLVWIAMQAVGLVDPSDLDVVVLSDDIASWAWLALTPHATRPTVLPATAEPSDLPPRRGARRLVVLDRVEAMAWYDDRSRRDDYLVWRVDDIGAVPASAATVVASQGDCTVRFDTRTASFGDVLVDRLFDQECAIRFAAALGGLRSASASGGNGVVDILSLIPALLSSDALVGGWQSSTMPLRFAIGSNRDGATSLQLSGQNSHMLVAGTTGSGKTRLLETLAVSLAATYSPDAVQFFVIDFKGGNELAALSALPHCGGIVSDRDLSNVDRAIAALTREIARRDALFAAAAATDIDDYARKSTDVMPRLVVIADEFGQFRRDDAAGDRVGALLRVAAQGRSKGIHLVLATQSPSTDVTAEIRQNVGTRVCLRVAEASESVAVLGSNDAVDLRTPGEVLIAVDGEIHRSHVAMSRGAHTTQPRPVAVNDLLDYAVITPSAPAGELELLDELIDRVGKAAAAIGFTPRPLLTDALPDSVARTDLAGSDRSWTVGGFVLGLRDRPGVADAGPFVFDPPRDGTLTVVGGPRSGRTTALLAIAEAARMQRDESHPVVVHAIDWSGDLEVLRGAEYDAGVVRRGDVDHLRRTLHTLQRDAGATRVVLIDRLDSLLRDAREIDGGALAVAITETIATARNRRIYVVATVDPAAMVANALGFGGARLVLPITDSSMRVAAGLPAVATATPGRGVSLADGDLVQIGMASTVVPTAAPPHGQVAPMPAVVSATALGAVEGERFLLGLGGRGALAPLAVQLDDLGALVAVIGRRGSGRSTALDAIAATYAGARRMIRVDESSVVDWDRSQPPTLLLVDDTVRAAQRHAFLADPSLEDTLRAGGHVLIGAFDQAELTGLGFNHWLTRRPCSGLLLSLDSTADRMVAGERLGFHPPAELRSGPAGRGWWCHRGVGTPVQVATI